MHCPLAAPVGVRASEAKAINLSLTVLGMCINARASASSTHAPYRDSKLTRILKVCACSGSWVTCGCSTTLTASHHVLDTACLQESLGGNARTSLVVAVADAVEHCDESLQSLQFGTRAMFVENSVSASTQAVTLLCGSQCLALNRSNIQQQSWKRGRPLPDRRW